MELLDRVSNSMSATKLERVCSEAVADKLAHNTFEESDFNWDEMNLHTGVPVTSVGCCSSGLWCVRLVPQLTPLRLPPPSDR